MREDVRRQTPPFPRRNTQQTHYKNLQCRNGHSKFTGMFVHFNTARLSPAFTPLPFVCHPLVTPKSCDGSVGTAMSYGFDGQGPIPGRGNCSVQTGSEAHLALSHRVKRLGREADHSPPSSVDVENGGAIPPLPHTSSWRST
jgi:hypothetical protein